MLNIFGDIDIAGVKLFQTYTGKWVCYVEFAEQSLAIKSLQTYQRTELGERRCALG